MTNVEPPQAPPDSEPPIPAAGNHGRRRLAVSVTGDSSGDAKHHQRGQHQGDREQPQQRDGPVGLLGERVGEVADQRAEVDRNGAVCRGPAVQDRHQLRVRAQVRCPPQLDHAWARQAGIDGALDIWLGT